MIKSLDQVCSSTNNKSLPRHAAVDSEVYRVGQTNDHVDEKDDVRDQVVVKEVLPHAVIEVG